MSELVDWRSLFDPFGLISTGARGFLPVSAEELEELRARCGASVFPPLFVDMATSLGNIAFTKSVSIISPGGEKFGDPAFYGGGAPADIALLWMHEMFVENTGFPSYWVPFARNLGGWPCVFDSRDAVAPVWMDRGDPALVPVANSFENFILGLRIDSNA